MHARLTPFSTQLEPTDTGSKNGKSADETTTIVTFEFDESTRGKTCELLFELWDRDVSNGTRTLDVFTYSDPSMGPRAFSAAVAAKWASTKSRDNHVGRIRVPKPGNATWEQSYQGWPKIPCPAGQLVGVEYVGVSDRIQVRWDIGVTGPRFRVMG
ncbi:Ubiquitin 3 binding protein But2, C-terminal [Fusarium oxysporum f. sp. vasinfectum]|nr:Ubiquitin 3 binding protein But2, C-terminal [Fusarium oxysporum f. sp. vasinfectum]